MNLRSFGTLTLLLLFCSPALTQEKRPDWIGTVENALKDMKTPWAVNEVRVRGGKPDSFVTASFLLKSGESTAAVQITSYYILENPEETYAGSVIASDNILGRTHKKVILKNFGDEGVVYFRGEGDGYAQLQLRKGKTFVTVFIPGLSLAKDIAQTVLKHIP